MASNTSEPDAVPDAEHGLPWSLPETVEPQIDDVPDFVREAARQAFDARLPGVVVADLVFDSLVDGERRGVVRPTERSLRFGAEEGVEMMIEDEGPSISLTIRLAPPRRAAVEVRCSTQIYEVNTDAAGRAALHIPPGLLSVVVRPRTGRPIQTAWMQV